ncbi:hypothetical protein N9937_00475, partial [bacterium]|nr:hypothetical protein [bacterium]
QLFKFLWPEVHKWARRIKWDMIPRKPFDMRTELLTTGLKLNFGEAFAAASDKPDLIEGAHADYMMYIYDESKSITEAAFDASEGSFSTSKKVIALAMSTPGASIGRFYDIHKRKPGYEDWDTDRVTLEECIEAERVRPDWAAQRAKQWGKASALYRNHVEGEFAADEEDGIIPLAWVEAAQERYFELETLAAERNLSVEDYIKQTRTFSGCGVDVADTGGDSTVIAEKYDNVILPLRKYPHADPMQTAGHVIGIMRSTGCGTSVVDATGVGAGTHPRIREEGFPAVPFVASAKSTRKDRSGELGFFNKRAEAWWTMREILQPGSGAELCLPDDDILVGDLTCPMYEVRSGGKIKVEGKKEMKKRLGRSPDDGDAVIMICNHLPSYGNDTWEADDLIGPERESLQEAI